MTTPTGADNLVHALKAGGVELCFANPGTSEMHIVAALDRDRERGCARREGKVAKAASATLADDDTSGVAGGATQYPALRTVLVLFEGVAAGAADGYARMRGRAAATLLHLGPGLANALSALHNAKRAPSPLINIIGNHATFHLQHDAPLTSDIAGVAHTVSHWVKTTSSAAAVAGDVAQAIFEANHQPGRIASLIVPADCAWSASNAPPGTSPARQRTPPASASASRPSCASLSAATCAPGYAEVPARQVEEAVQVLRNGGRTLLLLGGNALYRRPLQLAARIAEACNAEVRTEVFNSRAERGAGIWSPPRIPYPVDQATDALATYRNIVLVGAVEPVAFFAYPERPSLLKPPGCRIVSLATPQQDCTQALDDVVQALGARPSRTAVPRSQAKTNSQTAPPLTHGALTPRTIGACLAHTMPEGVIVVDESQTTGFDFLEDTRVAPPHDWLRNRGGSIGAGPPLATGAALACPERPVLCLQSDGSGMYSLQALWTQARERLAVTTVVFANREYKMLRGELHKAGIAKPGACALDLLQIDRPTIDWVSLARGMGVDGCRVQDTQALCAAMRAGLASGGPYLIEATV